MHPHGRDTRPATGHAGPDSGPDLAVLRLPTVIGRLRLFATGAGLAYIAFETEDPRAVWHRLGAAVGTDPVDAVPGSAPAGHLHLAAEQITAYLDGTRRTFELPLDTGAPTGFRDRAQRALAGIDYGTTVSYTELAARLGSPGAARAVGSACATNPLPLIWPCHRVLRGDGTPGGYRGGLPAKRHLLELEGAPWADGDRDRRGTWR